VADPQGTAWADDRGASTEVDLAPGEGSPYAAVVTLRGSHDLTTSGELKQVLAPLGGDVLLNLSKCEFIDSTVIGLVIGKARALKCEGSYLELLVTPSSQVERALESLGIDELVTLHEHMPSDDLA
jgi:anti-anti-sigma factor